MVWFQCEDCGENLKKPKLAAHFRVCYASKLSCIDCGEMFCPETVQKHTQCITEAEKYGPKGHAKPSHGGSNTPKTNNSNQKPEVDINVGLSSRPPWYCSLCKTNATSSQALLLHAEGKKHRGKARAFHAANQKSNEAEEPNGHANIPGSEGENEKPALVKIESEAENNKRRRSEKSGNDGPAEKKARDTSAESGNGEVIQADPEKAKCGKKIKWKKLIASALKAGPNEGLKIKKLKKLVINPLREAGAKENENQLMDTLEHKLNSSSKFEIVGKYVRLATKS